MYKLPLAGLTSADVVFIGRQWSFHCKTTYMLSVPLASGSLEVRSVSTYEIVVLLDCHDCRENNTRLGDSRTPLANSMQTLLFIRLADYLCASPYLQVSSASKVHAAPWPSISPCKTSTNSSELTVRQSRHPNPADNKPASTLNTCRKHSTAQQHRRLTASLVDCFRIAGIRIVISRPRCCHSLRDCETMLRVCL